MNAYGFIIIIIVAVVVVIVVTSHGTGLIHVD